MKTLQFVRDRVKNKYILFGKYFMSSHIRAKIQFLEFRTGLWYHMGFFPLQHMLVCSKAVLKFRKIYVTLLRNMPEYKKLLSESTVYILCLS